MAHSTEGNSKRSPRTRISRIARRVTAIAVYSAFMLIVASVSTFILLEASPSLRRAVGATKIRLWALQDEFEADPVLVFKRRKGIDSVDAATPGDLYRDEFGIDPPTITTEKRFDEFGFRNEVRSSPVDILVIGDSFVEVGETNDDTLSSLIARSTGRSTYNLGRGWYGPHQYVELLRRHAPRLQPKWAIYCHFDGNDAGDTHQYADWQSGGTYYDWDTASLGFRRHFATAASQIWALALSRIHATLRERFGPLTDGTNQKVHPDVAIVELGGRSVPMAFAYFPSRKSADELLSTDRWQAIGAQLATFREEADERGIESLAVFIPTKLQVNALHIRPESGKRVRKSAKRTLPFLDTSAEVFRILARDAGMRAIDLTPELRRHAARGEALYHPFDTHWNSAGRRAAAETIALALED